MSKWIKVEKTEKRFTLNGERTCHVVEWHTEECLAKKKKLEEYKENWPNYCRNCHATGILVYLWGGQGICRDCFGSCPRCGYLFDEKGEYDIFVENQTPCPICHWSWGKGKDDFPPSTECRCVFLENYRAPVVEEIS